MKSQNATPTVIPNNTPSNVAESRLRTDSRPDVKNRGGGSALEIIIDAMFCAAFVGGLMAVVIFIGTWMEIAA